jgi:hypothetical protein
MDPEDRAWMKALDGEIWKKVFFSPPPRVGPDHMEAPTFRFVVWRFSLDFRASSFQTMFPDPASRGRDSWGS